MKLSFLKKAKKIQDEIDDVKQCISEMEYILKCNDKTSDPKYGRVRGRFSLEGVGWQGWKMTKAEVDEWAKNKKREAEIELAHKQALFDVL